MSAKAQPDRIAQATAEEVLRTLYGDDYKGCTVNPDKIAAIIEEGANQRESSLRELLELYDKLVEAIHLLSTPPDGDKVTEPKQLQTLLSERLDAIRALTKKTMETTALVKKTSGASEG